jgi:hypothetical protein
MVHGSGKAWTFSEDVAPPLRSKFATLRLAFGASLEHQGLLVSQVWNIQVLSSSVHFGSNFEAQNFSRVAMLEHQG